MFRKLPLSLAALLVGLTAQSQVVINEIDSDTPGADQHEFVELKTPQGYTTLDGYVLVFFNGSTSSSTTGLKSYYAVDLTGITTDINGLALVGNAAVSPVPDLVIPDNTIQNGADAIAIYQGGFDYWFSVQTASQDNLIDAVAYDTSDADAVELMTLLGISVQYNENQHSQATSHSVQRNADGTFFTGVPTPFVHNDGSGEPFIGVGISVSTTELYEGEQLQVRLYSNQVIPYDFSPTISANFDGFTTADFQGNLAMTIPTGQTEVITTLTILEDDTEEGDEQMRLAFNNLPAGFKRLTDDVRVDVLDADFQVMPWGKPTTPTFGVVEAQIPAGYYDALDGKSGVELKNALRDIIANPAVVRGQTYGDALVILHLADQDPENSNKIWQMYVEQPRSKFKYQMTSSNIGVWNREHIFPQSRGMFSNATPNFSDGPDIFMPASAFDLTTGHSDAHHIRAEDGVENSSRSNRDYGSDYNGPEGNAGSWKGDVARALFYMAVRYQDLQLVEGNPEDTIDYQIGDLISLLEWNDLDPADDFEMNRNNIIYDWQYNRNPFIDYPELVDYIFGARQNEVWNNPLSTGDFSAIQFDFMQNPVRNQLEFTASKGYFKLYDMTGKLVLNQAVEGEVSLKVTWPKGVYLAVLATDKGQRIHRLLVD